MEKKKIDWENLGFSYMPTDKRYVANFKDGKWDDGALITRCQYCNERMCRSFAVRTDDI